MPSATRTATPSPRPRALAGRRGPRLAALLGATLSLATAAGAIAQQSFDVAMRDGLLSIRANGVTAASLAAALAEETGVRFVVAGDAEQRITTEIVDEPLIRAVGLLSPNHLLVRGDGGANAPVIEVVLMMDDAPDGGGGGGGETEFLPSGAPAEEVFAGEDSMPPTTGELGFEPGDEGAMEPPTIDADGFFSEDQFGPDDQPPER